MLWLGLAGRRKIAALEERQELLEKLVRQYDGEVTDAIDRLEGIAKRFTGRKGGRPPAAQLEMDSHPEFSHLDPISRDIMLERRRGRGQ